MRRGPLILAALLTLTACATAPEPEPQAGPEVEEYVIYGQCEAADLAACASQIVSGARMLTKPAR